MYVEHVIRILIKNNKMLGGKMVKLFVDLTWTNALSLYSCNSPMHIRGFCRWDWVRLVGESVHVSIYWRWASWPPDANVDGHLPDVSTLHAVSTTCRSSTRTDSGNYVTPHGVVVFSLQWRVCLYCGLTDLSANIYLYMSAVATVLVSLLSEPTLKNCALY